MEEWQMFDRDRLLKIQEEEEEAFKQLPENVQKLAYALDKGESVHEPIADGNKSDDGAIIDDMPKEVPPLLSDNTRQEKEILLSEGFSDWNRHDYSQFVKASAKYGRIAIDKIANEVRKPENAIVKFSDAFWGETGKARISEMEYDRVVKLIEKGEKKIAEIKSLERATGVLIHHFDSPWRELEFVHVNCKDKMFTAEEDRHLLCWSYKVRFVFVWSHFITFVLTFLISQYGYGQWLAIKFAIRRNPAFRFDYFLRSLPIDQIARRCEQLMKATEKEVEHLERKARELLGLPTEAAEGEVLPPVQLPKFRELQRQRHIEARANAEKERKELEENMADIEAQIKQAQARLKSLNEGFMPPPSSADVPLPVQEKSHSRRRSVSAGQDDNRKTEETAREMAVTSDGKAAGAIGPGGKFLEFPEYGGIEHPVEWKKPFFHYCLHAKKDVKSELDPADRKDKVRLIGVSC
jgi:SWI/SNF-related matrix-associated actin-dependent regulator of chromatin subfamily A member 5